jgi:hypothetical protein
MAAWVILAAVLSPASSRLWPFEKAVAGAIVFAAILVFVIRALRPGPRRPRRRPPNSAGRPADGCPGRPASGP